MAKDYVHRGQHGKAKNKKHRFSSSTSNKERRLPWRAIITLILLLVLFVFALTFLKRQSSVVGKPASSDPVVQSVKPVVLPKKDTVAAEPNKKEANKKEREKQLPEVHFSFYNVLPQSKVMLNEEESNETPLFYFLQLASVSNLDQVKVYQEKFRTLDCNAKVVTIKKGEKAFYRVQVGYFNTKKEALRVQSRLEKKEMESILLKMPVSDKQKT